MFIKFSDGKALSNRTRIAVFYLICCRPVPALNKGALPLVYASLMLRLENWGHCLLFSQMLRDLFRFVEDVLECIYPDRSGEVCCFYSFKGGSDHHVLALLQSKGIACIMCFMLSTPDEVE